jgi:hypothetical protein
VLHRHDVEDSHVLVQPGDNLLQRTRQFHGVGGGANRHLLPQAADIKTPGEDRNMLPVGSVHGGNPAISREPLRITDDTDNMARLSGWVTVTQFERFL